MSADPFSRAIRDCYLGEQDEPLIDRDGDETREHDIQGWYFDEHDQGAWRDSWLEGPLLDMGAGAGRDALYYQEQFETVAIEVSDHLVETVRMCLPSVRVRCLALHTGFITRNTRARILFARAAVSCITVCFVS